MKVNEIFKSISGESIEAGRLAIFIRLFGCQLACSYCDSTYACYGDDYVEMSISEILHKVNELHCNKIVLTGGEPLLQVDSYDLIYELVKSGYSVEIETNGAVDLFKLRYETDILLDYPDKVIVTMDWKCPSSKMRHKMIPSNLSELRPTDVLKCVVGSKEDLDEMKRVSTLTAAQVFVSPVFGQIEPKDIVQYMIDNELNDVRFQLQIHKYVWPSNMRGV